MKITTRESQAEQARRLAAKTQDQRMVNEVVSGTGMSPWEAQVVVDVIREVYFATPGNAPLRHGQLLYTCVKVEAWGCDRAVMSRNMKEFSFVRTL